MRLSKINLLQIAGFFNNKQQKDKNKEILIDKIKELII